VHWELGQSVIVGLYDFVVRERVEQEEKILSRACYSDCAIYSPVWRCSISRSISVASHFPACLLSGSLSNVPHDYKEHQTEISPRGS